MTITDTAMGVYYLCSRQAKYITPKGPLNNGIRLYVCGIHKNSIDAMHKRIGSKERCEKL